LPDVTLPTAGRRAGSARRNWPRPPVVGFNQSAARRPWPRPVRQRRGHRARRIRDPHPLFRGCTRADSVAVYVTWRWPKGAGMKGSLIVRSSW